MQGENKELVPFPQKVKRSLTCRGEEWLSQEDVVAALDKTCIKANELWAASKDECKTPIVRDRSLSERQGIIFCIQAIVEETGIADLQDFFVEPLK